jgi:putative acetyltransferase
LEELAASAGYRTIRLATGERRPEAIALYERCGYRSTEPYGKYVNDQLARCYQKAPILHGSSGRQPAVEQPEG